MGLLFPQLILSFFVLFGLKTPSQKEVHPLHVSTTDVVFNEKQKDLEISTRIFTDDFENALRKLTPNKVDLIDEKMHESMDLLVKKYMLKHLQLEINGQKCVLSYIGFELDREVINVYLEIENVNYVQKISVHNQLLYDLFDDQMNLLNLEYKKVKRTLKFNYPNNHLQILL